MSQLVAQVVLATLFLASCLPVSAQFSKDPVMDLAIRKAIGLPSLADMAQQAVARAGEMAATKVEASARIAHARERFWRAYPGRPGLPEAQAEFERLLLTKDLMYFIMALGNGPFYSNPLAADFTGGAIDGGIAVGAEAAFQAWIRQVNNIFRFHSGEDGFRFAAEILKDPGGALKRIEQTLPAYAAYAARRNFEEFRRANIVPAEVNPEYWRLAMVGFRYAEQGGADAWKRQMLKMRAPEADFNRAVSYPAIQDPYGDAARAFANGGGFPRKCEQRLPGLLGPSIPPSSCSCVHKQLMSNLSLSEQWHIETRYTDGGFLAYAVSKVGLKDKVAACLR